MAANPLPDADALGFAEMQVYPGLGEPIASNALIACAECRVQHFMTSAFRDHTFQLLDGHAPTSPHRGIVYRLEFCGL